MQTHFADFTSLDYYRRERIWWAFIQEVLRCWTKIIARAMNPNVNITVYGKRICWLYLHVYDDFATRDVHFSPKPRPDGDVKYVLNGYLNHNINRKQKKNFIIKFSDKFIQKYTNWAEKLIACISLKSLPTLWETHNFICRNSVN